MKIKSLMTMSILGAAMQLAPVSQGQPSDQPGKGWRHNHEERFANLSPEERQKVEAAHQKAMQDPAVQAAHEKMRQAHRELYDAMHAAMLKADPSIQPILDKMDQMPKREKPED
jgi:Heavy-metal resistance